MTVLLRSKFVVMDSGDLGKVIRDKHSSIARERQRAEAFERAFDAQGCMLVLSLHHLQELLSHGDKHVVAQRVSYLRQLPMVACVASPISDGVMGSILDILIHEAGTAYAAPHADAATIRDCVAAKLFRLDTGVNIMAPFLGEWASVQAMFREQEKRSRELVAISRSGFAGIAKTKVRDWLMGSLRSPEDIARRFEAFNQRLAFDILTRGDKRIPDAKAIAATFFADVQRHAASTLTGPKNPAEQFLSALDIDLAEIGEDMTIGELGDLASFRQKLRVANRTLALPWPKLKASVQETRLPSGVIQTALRKFGQDLPERKGSELADTYLACLSAYADITYVDKRMLENFRRARQKSPAFASITREAQRAGSYHKVAQRLAAQ